MPDFATYELTKDFDLYGLAEGLVPEIAEAIGYELTDTPDEANLQGFIKSVGPDKELQKNIGLVRERLGRNATTTMADWVERSGILFPVERGFMYDTPLPQTADAVIWNGAMANWMLRRAAMTQRLDPEKFGRVILPMGTREVKPGEHQLAATYQKRYEGKLATETTFVKTYIADGLKLAGFSVELVPIDSKNGSKILEELFTVMPELLDGTVIVPSNAPNAVQAAGQLRAAAQKVNACFDSTGDQLSMMSDSIAVARRGEAPKTNQNPETALGQIGRNGLYLERNKSSHAPHGATE